MSGARAPAAACPDPSAAEGAAADARTEWRAIVAEFQQPSNRRALWQLCSTFVPYWSLWVLMYFSHTVSWWITAPLAMLAGGLLLRVFIIFHDCGHGSYFRSRRANDWVGSLTGVLALTPYYQWRWEHAIHHSSAGHLDKRGIGDVWTMTVEEYRAASRWKRFAYQVVRHPLVLFVVAPLLFFVVIQRIPAANAAPRERRSVWWTSLGIVALAALMSQLFGLGDYLLIKALETAVAGASGVWLFYVQHQFEGVYWERAGRWDHAAAALRGSSFYKLPAVLQWFSGNIGFHHVHHLSARIPNYHLQRCHEAHPLFRQVRPMTLLSSLRSLRLHLWDEQAGRLVGYRALRQPPRG